jgi:hypothetical protein
MLKLDQEFLEAVAAEQEPEYYYFRNKANTGGFDWNQYTDLLDKVHPDSIEIQTRKMKLGVTGLERRSLRPFVPSVISNGVDTLQELFPNNTITAHIFSGFTSNSQSFGIHCDAMHVLYIQLYGSVNWSIWHENEPNEIPKIQPDEGTLIESKTLNPGDVVFVRAKTFHFVEPLQSRIGLSLGVEGLKK